MPAKFETLNDTEWDQVAEIWDLLDRGEIEASRRAIGALLAARPGHADLRIVDAAVALEEGAPHRALEALKGAERSADPALFFHLRALGRYELAEFERARADANRALTVHPGLAEAHDLLSRIAEHLGQPEQAREHAEAARAVDDASAPDPLEMTDGEFDAIVAAALSEMPEPVKRALAEVPVLVEPLPSRALLGGDDAISPDVLGLFVGLSLRERSVNDPPRAPGAIYIYRRNLLRVCADAEELKREVRITVQHEVGHLLGLNEGELENWGLG
jgi:predicted Zn-dependent protease with MMP-like domain